jgi:leucine-rich repeat protein
MTKQENEIMLEQIKLFKEQTEYTLEVKEGIPYYYGSISCISDELPDNLVINGNLFCHVRSTKLPKGLKVTGRLDAAGTKITEIPDDCEFSYLDISNTRIQKLRDNLVLEALIAYNSSLIDLPKGLKVKGDLNISNTSITEIPDDCEFDGLYMFKTKITKLHDNMELNYLNVRDSPLTEPPKNLIVYNFLNIENTRIKCMSENCLTPLICCNFELNDERYEKKQIWYISVER